MFCEKCGSPINDGDMFCQNCGTPVAPVAPVVEPEPTHVPLTQAVIDSVAGDFDEDAPMPPDDLRIEPPHPGLTPPVSVDVLPDEPPMPEIIITDDPTIKTPPETPPQHQPLYQLKTNRSFIKTLLLSIITFGIYLLITYGGITDDVNQVCSPHDGKKSMNYYLLVFIVTPITAGIANIVWQHNICNRIGDELKRRNIDYSFGAKDFWLWGILGFLIIVGPFVYLHKFFKAVNLMNENYNMYG